MSSKAATGADKKVPVPETVLKQKKTLAQIQAERAAKKAAAKKANAETRRTILKRAEKYAAEYRRTERALIRNRRIAKNSGNFYVEPEPKLAFVIRIRGYVSPSSPFLLSFYLVMSKKKSY